MNSLKLPPNSKVTGEFEPSYTSQSHSDILQIELNNGIGIDVEWSKNHFTVSVFDIEASKTKGFDESIRNVLFPKTIEETKIVIEQLAEFYYETSLV